MKYFLNKNKGFTLIELLVVVSIISLLSSIVLASIQDARYKAKLSALKQYAVQIRNAIELYRLENNNNLPQTADINWLITRNGLPIQWQDDFPSFLVNERIGFVKNGLTDDTDFNYEVVCGKLQGPYSESFIWFESTINDPDIEKYFDLVLYNENYNPYDETQTHFYCLSI